MAINSDNPTRRQWQGRTSGTSGMQHTLILLLRVVPCYVFYIVLILVVPLYMLFGHKGFISNYRYFRQRVGYGKIKSFFSVYLNHFLFGQIVIDRFALYAGKHYNIAVDNYEIFDKLAMSEKGFLILSSHIGCFEIAGCMLVSYRKPFNVVVYAGETSAINMLRDGLEIGHNIKMIPVKDDLSHIYRINNAINSGEIVSILADRINGSSQTIPCVFMGGRVQLPKGPFALARDKDLPMLSVFVMKERMKQYHVIIDKVDNAQQFADRMEDMLRKYPCQWFNFYEFWQNELH